MYYLIYFYKPNYILDEQNKTRITEKTSTYNVSHSVASYQEPLGIESGNLMGGQLIASVFYGNFDATNAILPGSPWVGPINKKSFRSMAIN